MAVVQGQDEEGDQMSMQSHVTWNEATLWALVLQVGTWTSYGQGGSDAYGRDDQPQCVLEELKAQRRDETRMRSHRRSRQGRWRLISAEETK
jgi:hypothetical protein